MIIDQAEIDALLGQANGLAEAAAQELSSHPAPAAPPPPRTVARPAKQYSSAKVARLMRLRVPVIVHLARRLIPISDIRSLSVGAILEFEKHVEEPLDLLINDRLIGHGSCVKVGENFGLRVTSVCDRSQRIRSMAGTTK